MCNRPIYLCGLIVVICDRLHPSSEISVNIMKTPFTTRTCNIYTIAWRTLECIRFFPILLCTRFLYANPYVAHSEVEPLNRVFFIFLLFVYNAYIDIVKVPFAHRAYGSRYNDAKSTVYTALRYVILCNRSLGNYKDRVVGTTSAKSRSTA